MPFFVRKPEKRLNVSINFDTSFVDYHKPFTPFVVSAGYHKTHRSLGQGLGFNV